MIEQYNCQNREPLKLYKIGMFAQMNRITIKTLRYYDDIDLLKPEMVDETSGYRYYTSSQLQQLHKILSLREMDFTIDEIKQVMQGLSEKNLLLKKKNECLHEMSRITKKLAIVESYLSGQYLENNCQVVIKPLPSVKIAYRHITLSKYDDLFQQMPLMGMEMEKAGCICAEPEYCFTIYCDESYKEEDVEVKICESVTEIKEDTPLLKFKELPEVELAACTLHKGPYTKLPQAYQSIVQFIEESGYEIIGSQRESYIDGIWNKDSEDEWLTEIQFPVRKI